MVRKLARPFREEGADAGDYFLPHYIGPIIVTREATLASWRYTATLGSLNAVPIHVIMANLGTPIHNLTGRSPTLLIKRET